tara:strand:+ start:221 stop:691 length:471 start_codon:yes stop_codon:yes gene_type:complete
MGHAWCGRACERRLGLCLSPHRCAVKLSVLEHFMGAFKEVYRKRHMHPSSTGGLPDEQIYFVGRKPRGRRGGADGIADDDDAAATRHRRVVVVEQPSSLLGRGVVERHARRRIDMSRVHATRISVASHDIYLCSYILARSYHVRFGPLSALASTVG